jgi:hypothetical protein
MTRDETAWTWWTLPSAIAGCAAQRYQAPTGLFLSPPDQAERVAVARSWRPAGGLLVASGYQEWRAQPLPGFYNGVVAKAVPMRLMYWSHGIARCGWPACRRAFNRRSNSPDLDVFAVAAAGVLCAFPTRGTHYLSSVSAAGLVQIPCRCCFLN